MPAEAQRIVLPDSRLAVSKRFGMYKEEPKQTVRNRTSKPNAIMDYILFAWTRCELEHCYAGTHNPFGDSYNVFLDALKALNRNGIVYSSSDVARFAEILPGLYDGDKNFYAKAGMFLSALINNGKDESYEIWLSDSLATLGNHLNSSIAFFGYENTKNITVHGNVGWCPGYLMKSGEIVIEGNGGDYAGCFMEGGRLVVKGECGEWVGNHMSGGEIHLNNSSPIVYSSTGTVDNGKIYHKGELIVSCTGIYKTGIYKKR